MVDRGSLDTRKDLSYVNPSIRSQAPIDQVALLSPYFSPCNWDVICMGGKEHYEHVGNRRFRICISNNLDSYMKANTKQQKSLVVSNVVTSIRDSSTSGGGFVRQDFLTRQWFKVSDKVARDKVGQALRDAIRVRKNLKRGRDENITTCKQTNHNEDDSSHLFCEAIHQSRKKKQRMIARQAPIERDDERVVTEKLWVLPTNEFSAKLVPTAEPEKQQEWQDLKSSFVMNKRQNPVAAVAVDELKVRSQCLADIVLKTMKGGVFRDTASTSLAFCGDTNVPNKGYIVDLEPSPIAPLTNDYSTLRFLK